MRILTVLFLSALLVLGCSSALAQEEAAEAAEKKAEKAKDKAKNKAEKAAKKAAKAGEKAADKAEEASAEAASGMPSHEEMMKAWQESAKPGPQHEEMAKGVGSWSLTFKDYMTPGEPKVSEGKAERSMIFDGRVLKEEVEGEAGGQPFQGLSYAGYDNVTGKYWSTWIDDMSTGVMHITADEGEGDKLTWMGKSSNPITGTQVDMKIVTTTKSEDEELMEFYMPGPDGEMMKTMEIVYERQ